MAIVKAMCRGGRDKSSFSAHRGTVVSGRREIRPYVRVLHISLYQPVDNILPFLLMSCEVLEKCSIVAKKMPTSEDGEETRRHWSATAARRFFAMLRSGRPGIGPCACCTRTRFQEDNLSGVMHWNLDFVEIVQLLDRKELEDVL